MRMDKFLWCVRLYKTRSVAAAELKSERVLIDDIPVKSSREIRAGDVFTLKFHGYIRVFSVLDIPKSRVSAKLVPELIEEITPKSELEKMEFLKLARNLQRDRGTGRPTKRERRDLDKLL